MMRAFSRSVFGRLAISLEILKSVRTAWCAKAQGIQTIVAGAHHIMMSAQAACSRRGARRMCLQDAQRKKCAWTSHHKTVLTPPVGATFLKPEYGT
jgi:hypothetical protein